MPYGYLFLNTGLFKPVRYFVIPKTTTLVLECLEMSENKCKEVWAFTKECHTYFYHSPVHCQGINIPIAISNILFFGKIGGTLWRKIRNTFLQKIPVPMMTRVPVVCAVWWCDVCTAVGLSCAAGKLWVTTPGSTIWIEYQCGNLLMPRRLLGSGILEYFYAQNFAIHFAFTEKIWTIKHLLPLQ